jgi:hypothetical protein
LSKLSKILVFASLLAAVAFVTWRAHLLYADLLAITAGAAIVGLVGGRLAPRAMAASILLFVYWVPAIFAAVVGRYLAAFFVVWTGAMVGLLAGDRDRLTWSYPRQWRFALILWALVVALGWPLIALREMDFESLALLERYRIPNTGIGGSPSEMVTWAADFAILHLVGLLWVDWLFRRAASKDLEVQRWIALPLAVGAVAASALAIYQGVVDLSFLSGGLWPSALRAAGSLMDGNAFGMIAALWTAGLLAFSGGLLVRPLGLVGAMICWLGLWMSGSRTALVAAFVGLATVGLSALWRRGRIRAAVAAAVAIAGVALAVLYLPLTSQSPLQRLRNTLPIDASGNISSEATASFLAALWTRDSYGTASTALIVAHPAVGVGIGMCHMMCADYLRAHDVNITPDNAQNWWRHYIAEMGVMGSLGLLLWTVMFLLFLLRTSGDAERRLPAAALKGAMIAIGLVSLVGMPGQSLPVVITFWTFAFWYTRLVSRETAWPPGGLGPLAWTALVVVLVGYLGATFVLARRDLRPAIRAAEGGWRYAYGMYQPPSSPDDGTSTLWTEQHGVAVVPADGQVMVLSVRAEHPDATQQPVEARVAVNGQTVVDTELHTSAPIVKRVEMGPTPRAIIETRVDRTWSQAGESEGAREIGLALSWTFEGPASH